MISKHSFLQNVISPHEEMFAYETLWAMEDIKESQLKQLFKEYTPCEALETLKSLPKLNVKKDKSGSKSKDIPAGSQQELFAIKSSSLQKEAKPSPTSKELSRGWDQQKSLKTKLADLKKTQNEVDHFLKESLRDKWKTFSIVVNGSVQYPNSLTTDLPIGLFYYKGNLDLLSGKSISIVGARNASLKGISKAKQLTKELVAEDFMIVSGLAKGIDTVAHQSAITAKGWTIGVIGTPINKYYPKENKELQDKIAKNFLLISQVPFYKYAKEPFKHRTYHFPRRNRIMASISKATVIVEASDTSGSLVQARECLKQNKKLFIMDSCFENPKIKWPRSYEKKGAIKVKNTSDILKYINATYTNPV